MGKRLRGKVDCVSSFAVRVACLGLCVVRGESETRGLGTRPYRRPSILAAAQRNPLRKGLRVSVH